MSENARQLRKNMTDTEQCLWRHLRKKQLGDALFRRQFEVGAYIVDFVCLSARLIVECDGGQHQEQEAYDQKRDAYLRAQGFTILRFWNHEVLQETSAVLERILPYLTLHPNPPPQGRRELEKPCHSQAPQGRRELEKPCHSQAPQGNRGLEKPCQSSIPARSRCVDTLSYTLISNYGNDSIALIQWAFHQKLENVTLLSVDTGWAAPGWHDRVARAQTWAQGLGFKTQHLKAKRGFAELMRMRGNFPTPTLQWCAGFLKGLPILDWLDSPEGDPYFTSTILLAHRRDSSPQRRDLPERVPSSEHYHDRALWHPLCHHTREDRDQLIALTPFPLLPHRSLECDPCINSTHNDWLRLAPESIAQTVKIEHALGQRLFEYSKPHTQLDQAIQALQSQGQRWEPEENSDIVEMGCGSWFGCGE